MKKSLVSLLVESGIQLSDEGQSQVATLFSAAVLEEASAQTAVAMEAIVAVNEAHKQDLTEKTKEVCRLAVKEWQSLNTIPLAEETASGARGLAMIDKELVNLKTVIKMVNRSIEQLLPGGDSLSNWKKFKQAVEDAAKFFDMVEMNESTDEVSALKQALSESVAMNESLLSQLNAKTALPLLTESELALTEATKQAVISLMENNLEIDYDDALAQVLAEEAAKEKEAADKAAEEKEAADKKAEEDAKKDDVKVPDEKPAPKTKTIQEQTIEFIRTGKTTALFTPHQK